MRRSCGQVVMQSGVTLMGALIVASAPIVAHAQTPARQELTLDQVVERALRVNPDIVQANSSLSNASSGERVAKVGAYLPTLGFTAGSGLASTERWNPTTNTTVSGSQESYTAGLTASFDLYTGGRRTSEVKRTNAVSDAAQATLVEQTFAVTLAAKQAYFDVAKAGELVRVAEARLQRAREGLTASQRRLQVGTATRSDVLRSELEENNAKQGLASAQSQERTTAFALGRVVGSDAPVFAQEFTQQVPRALALSEEELIRIVQEQAPTVKSAEANFTAARATARSAHAAYLPTLRVSGGYDWFNQDPQFSDGRLSWTARLGLSYPIFNGFVREDNIARAESSARTAAATAADAKLAARADFERVMNALKLAEEQVALNKQAVEVAREDLRVQEERYKLGMSTILDRITSQVNLLDAENNEVVARYDYEIARAQLEALIGRNL